jgi:hypothetical protein
LISDVDPGHLVVGCVAWASTALAPKPMTIPAVTRVHFSTWVFPPSMCAPEAPGRALPGTKCEVRPAIARQDDREPRPLRATEMFFENACEATTCSLVRAVTVV